MSNEDRSSSTRTARLHCAPCRVIRSGGGGGGDPATWSQYPATQTVNLGCNDLNGVESVSFCDGTYMGPGGSFDISSNQNIDIISDQVRIGDAKGDRNNGTVVEVSNGGGSITLRAAVSDISSSTIEMGNGILKETRYDDAGVESSSITHGEDAEGKYIYMSVAGNEPTPVVVVKNTGIQPRQILDATNSSGGTGSYLTKDGVSNLTWIPIPPSVGGWYGIATSDLSMNGFNINGATRIIQNSTQPYPLSLYVSKSGNDTTGTGSQSNPFLTIQRAITAAELLSPTTNPWTIPTIFVGAGFYDEKLTIRNHLTITGMNPYLAANLAAYGGQNSTRIGNNTVNFVDISSGVANHTVRFENLDFRCRISNVERGTPTNALNLYMSYCSINKNSDPNPIFNISGVSSVTLSNVFMSNVRSNGTATSSTLAVYEFPNTNLYMENCRWNGTPSAVGMFRTTRALSIVNCELRYIAPNPGLPLFVLNYQGSQIARFTQCYLSVDSGDASGGANLFTVPSTSNFSDNGPLIQFDDCYMSYELRASPSAFILQNLNNQTSPSNRRVRLQFLRPSSISTLGGNSGIDYTNITVLDNSTTITRTNNFVNDISAGGIIRAGTDICGGIITGAAALNTSAILQADSTTRGFLPPRMTAAQAAAIGTPAEGLMVYVTNTSATFTSKGWWGWDGGAWKQLG